MEEEKDYLEDENNNLDEFCPCCLHEYDEIDYEYQICHICHFNNNIEENNNKDELSPL